MTEYARFGLLSAFDGGMAIQSGLSWSNSAAAAARWIFGRKNHPQKPIRVLSELLVQLDPTGGDQFSR